MTDETVGQPAAETPADPTTKVDDIAGLVPEAEAVEAATAESEAPVEDEFEEIDWDDGKKYKVPKALKDGVLRHKDYTQKTQGVADERRQLEQHANQLRQHAQHLAQRDQVRQQHVAAIGQIQQADLQIANIDRQLAQFANVDWAKLESEDPFKAQTLTRQQMQLSNYRNNLWGQRNGLAQQVHAREQQFAAERQRSFATEYQRTNEQLAREIPNWNQDYANELAAKARSMGLSDQQIAQWAISVPAVKMLHQVVQGEKFAKAQADAAEAAKKAAKAADRVEPTPLKKVSGAGAKTPVRPEDIDDMREYVRARQKQIEARAAR